MKKRSSMPRSKTDRNETVLTKKHKEADVRHIVRRKTISLPIDKDVLEWFKAQERRYQRRMNSVLRAFMDAQTSRF